MNSWSTHARDVPGLPPYPDIVAPAGVIGSPIAFLILVVSLVAAVSIVLYLLRASHRRNGTEARSVRIQTAVAAGLTVGMVWGLNAIVVGAINGAAVEASRAANIQSILAYNRQYAAAIDEVYGIDITADDANALLSGVEVDTTLPGGEPVSIMLVDEFEPTLGIMDAATEVPISPLG